MGAELTAASGLRYPKAERIASQHPDTQIAALPWLA